MRRTHAGEPSGASLATKTESRPVPARYAEPSARVATCALTQRGVVGEDQPGTTRSPDHATEPVAVTRAQWRRASTAAVSTLSTKRTSSPGMGAQSSARNPSRQAPTGAPPASRATKPYRYVESTHGMTVRP